MIKKYLVNSYLPDLENPGKKLSKSTLAFRKKTIVNDVLEDVGGYVEIFTNAIAVAESQFNKIESEFLPENFKQQSLLFQCEYMQVMLLLFQQKLAEIDRLVINSTIPLGVRIFSENSITKNLDKFLFIPVSEWNDNISYKLVLFVQEIEGQYFQIGITDCLEYIPGNTTHLCILPWSDE